MNFHGQIVGNMKRFTNKQITQILQAKSGSFAGKTVSPITIKKQAIAIGLIAFIVFTTGCATQKTEQGQTGKAVTQENIEISEDYNVDDDVREEFDKAVALMKQEKYAEAIMLFRAVTARARRFTGPLINLGIAYIRTDELEKAEETLKKALKLNRFHPVANNELALIFRRTGRFSEARQTYEGLLSQYPDFLPARKNLGVLCDIYIQDLECALKQYEFYLAKLPDDKKVKIWVADVKSRMK